MLTPADGTVPLLLSTAAALALFHTLAGVDHSIPFIVLGRARGWSLRRTLRLPSPPSIGLEASPVTCRPGLEEVLVKPHRGPGG